MVTKNVCLTSERIVEEGNLKNRITFLNLNFIMIRCQYCSIKKIAFTFMVHTLWYVLKLSLVFGLGDENNFGCWVKKYGENKFKNNEIHLYYFLFIFTLLSFSFCSLSSSPFTNPDSCFIFSTSSSMSLGVLYLYLPWNNNFLAITSTMFSWLATQHKIGDFHFDLIRASMILILTKCPPEIYLWLIVLFLCGPNW